MRLLIVGLTDATGVNKGYCTCETNPAVSRSKIKWPVNWNDLANE